MSFSANLDLVPVFLEADSREKLVRKMVINNYFNHAKFNYMEPRFEKNKYVVWFYADLKDYKAPDDLSEEAFNLLKSVKG